MIFFSIFYFANDSEQNKYSKTERLRCFSIFYFAFFAYAKKDGSISFANAPTNDSEQNKYSKTERCFSIFSLIIYKTKRLIKNGI